MNSIGINGIGHIALLVRDLDTILDFYTNQLGFAEMFRLYNDAGDVWIVYLRINDRVYLELFPKAGEGERTDDRFSHLCLEVDDIEVTIGELKARNIPLVTDIQSGKDGNKQAWIRDPEGNRIELMQIAPDSLQMQAITRLKQA
jgi:lactoylglutathione lyase